MQDDLQARRQRQVRADVTGADLERRRLVRFDADEVRGSGIPGHDAADQPAAGDEHSVEVGQRCAVTPGQDLATR